MSSAAYQGFDPRKFKTLLGSARSVSDQWADLLEPWQPDLEKLKDKSELPPPSTTGIPSLAGILPVSPPGPDLANRPTQPTTRQGNDQNAGILPAGLSTFLIDGTETLSDAFPDPVIIGQQYAAGGPSGRPPRRGGGPPEGPVGRFISQVYEAKLRTLAELDPSNELLTTIQAPDWRPSQSNINKIDLEIIKARQRAPGAIDSQVSGIGIGPFARESIQARSGRRDWTEEERAEINRIGSRYGCHTCGTLEPGSASGTFFLDHQSPTRLNPSGQNQIVLPQCMSCSVRQGGLVSSTVKRGKP
ncbi:MAG TPA: hypothetical protein VKY24_19005 [Reyranella sp.]|nr:hypothetical protein [Reyranella sp.]